MKNSDHVHYANEAAITSYLAVDDNLQIVGVKDAGHVRIELVKLVDDFAAADVPQNPVVEDKIVGRVKGRSISGVIVGYVPVHQLQRPTPYVVDEEAR